MYRFLKIIALLTLLVAVPSWAWSDQSHKYAQNFAYFSDDSFIQAVKGKCNELNDYYFNEETKDQSSNTTKYYRNSKYFHKKLKIKLKVVKNKSRSLYVIMPGSFTGYDSIQSKSLAKPFEKNNHTLYLPNPLSLDFTLANPLFMAGNFLKEAESSYDIIKDTVKKLKLDSIPIDNIVILSVSQGAFITAIMSRLDRKNKIIDKFFLFSPPFNILTSLLKLDQYHREVKDLYSFTPFLDYGKSFFKICKAKEDHFNTSIARRAKAISVIQGFQQELLKTYYQILKNIKDKKEIKKYEMKKGRFSSIYRQWSKNFNFKGYLMKINPKIHELMKSEKGNLSFWIDEEDNRVKIMTSSNDFINPIQIQQLKNNKNIIILENGSHFGYRGKWLQSLFYL